MVEDDRGAGEVVILGVVVQGNDGFEIGLDRRSDAVVGILEGETESGGESHGLKGVVVDIGGGFLRWDDVPGGDYFKPVAAARAEGVFEQGVDVVGGGGGDDRQAQVRGAGFGEEPLHTGAQGNRPSGEEDFVMLGFGFVQSGDPGGEVGLGGIGGFVSVDEMFDPLFAARDCEQFTVERGRPVPIESGGLEGLVEGDAVAVAFGIGQGAVNVEE